MHSKTDQDLVLEFLGSKGRDLRPYNEIIRRYEPVVYNLSFKYLRNQEVAEEVTQETFLKVYAQLERLRDATQLKSWVLRIASNLCTDLFRKQSRRTELKTQYQSEEMLQATTEEAADPRMEALKECMSILANRDQELIMLHYFSELTVKDLAEQLKLGVSAIKMRLSRCRDKLLACINKKM